MKLLVLYALVAVALCESAKDRDDGLAQWELFKIEHEKEYRSVEEEQLRQNIFLENLMFVAEHNAKYERGEVTFSVAINRFADMTSKEFGETMNGLKMPVAQRPTHLRVEELVSDDDLELPKSVDWRKKGAVTPVKDQGQCGSCWAFSATGALEGQTFIAKKKLVSLSEQNLVDCSDEQGNEGCSGGLMDYAFQYVYENKGVDKEESYPYKAEDQKCRYNRKNKGAAITRYDDVTQGSEKALQKAVAKIGPVAVGIDASNKSFQLYKSGVYVEPDCSPAEIDHGVLAVGYGTASKGGDYWLVKNSWGTKWGMQGYIMMARNHKNMCGISTLASYPSM